MTVEQVANLWSPYLTMAEGLKTARAVPHHRRVPALLLRDMSTHEAVSVHYERE